MIDMKNLSFSYGNKKVLDKINLSVHPGDFLGILGPNGSGKTTLIKLMNGFLPPDHGEILIKGRALKSYSARDLALLVSYVPQEIPVLFPYTVTEVVMSGRFPHIGPLGRESQRDMEIVARAMETARLNDLADKKMTDLSGGERQRATIAACFAQETEIILLDEPVSALDIRFQKEILNLVSSFNREEGRTVVMAIHDLNTAYRFCNRVVFLQNGSVAFSGETGAVMRQDVIEKVYDTRVLISENRDGRIFIPDFGPRHAGKGVTGLIEMEKERAENSMAAGFAHEIRNALQGSAMILEELGRPSAEREKLPGRINDMAALALKKGFSRQEMKELFALFRDISGDRDLDRMLKLCLRGVMRGLAIADSVMDYSRGLERGDELISLKETLEQIVSAQAPKFDQNRIEWRCKIPQGYKLKMGGLHFHAIMENLILNSIESIEVKEPAPDRPNYIEAGAHLENGHFQIALADNGTGISDKDLSKIFLPFFSTKPAKGTGLGLSMVHRLVNLYGGKIYVTSDEGIKTVFSLIFPGEIVWRDSEGRNEEKMNIE